MADEPENNPAATPGKTPENPAPEVGDVQPQLRIQKIYLKDVSFESPQSPGLFTQAPQGQQQVQLQINTETARLDNDLFECALSITVTVNIGETTAYLAEVKQAGLFTIYGFDEVRLGQLLGSYCPNLLFPYVREAISNLVQKGGFPQLLLDPVNFDALYAQHLEKARQNAPAPATQQ